MDWKDMLSQLRDGLPEGEDITAPEDTAPAKGERKKGKLQIFTEKKGRKGKVATIVAGFECDDDELQEIASEAKRHLGVGGSARGGEILIQGDCRERLAEFLRSKGYRV